MEFLLSYGLFLAKSFTVVIAFAICALIFVAIILGKNKKSSEEGELKITRINDKFDKMKELFNAILLDDVEKKKLIKEKKIKEKEEKKEKKSNKTPNLKKKDRLFVIDFDGDIKASQVDNLKEEVSAILTQANEKDEVVIKVNSPGGMVNTYGLAASEIKRFKDKKINITICVDKVAASGGYLIACLADKILAAPFAIIGSIGVVAQVPNFNKLLKKNDIDVEVLTAGKFKRTLTIFGENTKEGKEKFIDDLNTTHELFKNFVHESRPQVDIEEVSTGEYWYGQKALDLKLIDELKTSEDYIQETTQSKDVYLVKYEKKQKFSKKLGGLFSRIEQIFTQQNHY